MRVRKGVRLSGVVIALALALASPLARAESSPADAPLYHRIRSPWLTPEELPPPRPQETNYALAAAEALGVNVLTWSFDKITGESYADISPGSWVQNLRKGWIVDTDEYWENGLLHPVMGSLTYTAARSLGVGFYGSFGYSFAASFLWEEFGETQAPSFNDQVNTPFGGTLLGEARYRLHRLIHDAGGTDPALWQQVLAFLVDPITGLNELAFHDRYRGGVLLPLSWIGEFSFGLVVDATSKDETTGERLSGLGPWAMTEAHVVYGVPGTPQLRLEKPFDHFDLEIAVSATAKSVQPALAYTIRGLLLGQPIGPGGNFGGLWGLFATYDFSASPLFRATGFGLGPGVSLMTRSRWVELYGTALIDWVPWGAIGATTPLGLRDYHYGTGGSALLELRMQLVDRVTVRGSTRLFVVGGNYETGHSEAIHHERLELIVRLVGPHALSVQSDWSHRTARTQIGDIEQRGWVLSARYTVLSGW